MDICKRLRVLRESKGFSQGDIERRTGLIRCYVSRVENGHTVPSLRTLEKWARALEIETYQLFFAGNKKPVAPRVRETSSKNSEETLLLEQFRTLAAADQRLIRELMGKMRSQRRGE